MMKTDPMLLSHRGDVQAVCRTAGGDILLKMQKMEDPSATVVLEAFRSALATKASWTHLQDTAVVETLDLDEAPTADEVVEAIFLPIDSDIPVVAKPSLRKSLAVPRLPCCGCRVT